MTLIEAVRNYWKQTKIFERITLILNIIWLIFALFAKSLFGNFYLKIQEQYHIIYNFQNSMQITKSNNFDFLFWLGIIFIVLIIACVFFNLKIIFNFGNYLFTSRCTLFVLEIVNCWISYYALRYYVLGIVLVSLVTLVFSLIVSQ